MKNKKLLLILTTSLITLFVLVSGCSKPTEPTAKESRQINPIDANTTTSTQSALQTLNPSQLLCGWLQANHLRKDPSQADLYSFLITGQRDNEEFLVRLAGHCAIGSETLTFEASHILFSQNDIGTAELNFDKNFSLTGSYLKEGLNEQGTHSRWIKNYNVRALGNPKSVTVTLSPDLRSATITITQVTYLFYPETRDDTRPKEQTVNLTLTSVSSADEMGSVRIEGLTQDLLEQLNRISNLQRL